MEKLAIEMEEENKIFSDFIGKEIIIQGNPEMYFGKLLTVTRRYFILQNAKVMGTKNIVETPLLVVFKNFRHFHLQPTKIEPKEISVTPTKLKSQQIPKKEEMFPLDEIVIPKKFLDTPPRREKIEETIEFYKKHGKFDQPVIVRKNDLLLTDGYKRYIAAKEMGLTEILVKFIQ